jgi:hypothetical protein
LLQTLLQQSVSWKQRSLLAWHPDAAAHLPALQFVEQHSTPEEHAWPTTLHAAACPGTAAQVLPLQ